MVSVKGGVLEGLDWDSAIHIWTKSAMVPIPEGCESYSGEPTDSEYSSGQETLDQPPDQPGFLTGNGGFPDSTSAPKQGLCDLSRYKDHVI